MQLQHIKTYVLEHKIAAAFAALTLLLTSWWLWSTFATPAAQARYIVGTVSRGTVVAVVSGSGQVASSQQLDLKPKVSGQITYIGVTPGESVSAGTLIAVIDPTEAQKAVRDAQANLDSAKLSLAKLNQPATTLTITQQQNAIDQAVESLGTQYQSSFSDITATFLDLPSIITSLQDINFGTVAAAPSPQQNIDYYRDQANIFNSQASSFHDVANSDYQAARAAYDQTFSDFKTLSSTPDRATVDRILTETKTTAGLMATAAKSSNNLIQFYSDQLTQHNITPKTVATTQITNLNAYQTKLQAHITSLLSDQNNITAIKSSIVEKQQTLAQTQQGANTIDQQSSQLTITQRQNALQDAQEALANYYIRAPFPGVVASVAAHKYDQASGGTTVATIVTPQQLAELTLNEIDAAKIALGQKVTLTFDAITGLTLTGSVAEIDPVGTVTQGVVSYTVKISFDAQSAQIKPGMTVNASIQAGVHQDVLRVPQSAVKTQGTQKYVLAFTPPIASSTITAAGTAGILSATPPQQLLVTTGLSDDTTIEITSGLEEGQQIVTRTISPAAAAAAKTTPATTGGNRGGGIRIP